MSTLSVGTITNGTESSTTQALVEGSVKAWASTDARTPIITDSFNVSSLTDNAVGDIEHIFTNAFVNAGYALALSAAPGNTFDVDQWHKQKTTTSFDHKTVRRAAVTLEDSADATWTATGDLA